MIKRVILAVVQFAAFLGLLYLGGNWDAVNLSWELRQMQAGKMPSALMTTIKFQAGATHFLIAQGLLFATLLLVVILLGEAVGKKLKPYAVDTFAIWAIAIIIALAVPGWTLHAGTL